MARKRKLTVAFHVSFQAVWSDKTKTRMSVHCLEGKDQKPILDLKRAVKLSWAAYQSRTKGLGVSHVIEHGQFEEDGLVVDKVEKLNVCDYGINPFAP